MNTRSIAMIAILAVAAVAIVGAGYAAYWGQTEVENNTVDSRYIAVALTDGATDYAGINLNLDYNTTYSYSGGAKYDISPNGYKATKLDGTGDDYGFETKVTGYNLVPLKNKPAGNYTVLDNYKFQLKSPELTAEGAYDFQVTLTGVTLGSAATLYFAYTTTPDTLATDTTLYPFYSTGTPNEYVSVVTAPAIDQADVAGFNSVDLYGYLFVGITGAVNTSTSGDDTTHTVIVDDVNKAKAKIANGTLTFQALVPAEVVTVPTTISSTSATIEPGEDFSTVTIASCGGTNVTTVELAGNTITVTKDTGAATGYVLFKITNGSDTFYRVANINIAA